MEHAISSKVMTTLIKWRTPAQSVGLWNIYNDDHPTINVKLIVESSLILIIVGAAIETVVSAIFILLALPLDFITVSAPFEYGVKWIRSASFTIIWGFGNLYYNLFYCKITHVEHEARQFTYNNRCNI